MNPNPIPVLSRDRAQQMHRVLSSAFMSLGFILFFLQDALPRVHAILPDQKWISVAIIVVSSATVTWQKIAEANRITAAVAHPDATDAPTTPAKGSVQDWLGKDTTPTQTRQILGPDTPPCAPKPELPVGATSLAPLVPKTEAQRQSEAVFGGAVTTDAAEDPQNDPNRGE